MAESRSPAPAGGLRVVQWSFGVGCGFFDGSSAALWLLRFFAPRKLPCHFVALFMHAFTYAHCDRRRERPFPTVAHRFIHHHRPPHHLFVPNSIRNFILISRVLLPL
ncbi:hypothetical protein L6452_31401 [Arctium lappa]|uniref:Uncharacterized protein n=1 Tax=Arctium lappa TaxID=4217 RepID=A0ACB8Z0V9_ARCLA|nr:hypothetical protein L6452_31401 [Arctium lappa]